MGEDLKEFEKLANERNISDVDKMSKESKKSVMEIPNLKEKYKMISQARGHVIEASIKVEVALNELITKTGGKNVVFDHENQELNLITGVMKENQLGSLPSFNKRMRAFKEILEKLEKVEGEEISKEVRRNLNNLDRFAKIRDLFAHVPLNWFSDELIFDDNPNYKHYFKAAKEWKVVDVAMKEFMEIQKWILDLIPTYINLILRERDMLSGLYLGKSFDEVVREGRSLEESKE